MLLSNLSNSQREFSQHVIESRMSWGLGACNSRRIAATSLVPNDNARAPSSKKPDEIAMKTVVSVTVECKVAKQKMPKGCPPHGCSQDSDYQSFLLQHQHDV
jgi:hypothetical protein